MNGMIEWFAKNPIAANILMAVIIFGGVTTWPQLDREFFPSRALDQVLITMAYPGAGPEEVEQQLVNRIEEAIDDVNGISEVRSRASEGLATVNVDVNSAYSSLSVFNDIKTRLDAVTNFPDLAEPPEVQELVFEQRTVSIALYGDLPEAELKELGLSLRDRLVAHPDIPKVELRSPRDYELGIELSEQALRRYGLDFDRVALAIQNASLNIPAGKLRTREGDIQIQSRAQAYTAQDFERIVLLSNSEGAEVLLGDVAEVVDGFEEMDIVSTINDRPMLSIDVKIAGNPDITKTSDAARAFVDEVQAELPPGVELYLWRDMAVEFRGRIDTLLGNGLGGLVLVFALLLLFLRPILAIWVCVGIATAFLGAVAFMPMPGISLNMVSLFAFIMILGILVDDAIIVGESVHSHQERGLIGLEGAVQGAQRVMKPVLFAVISTMIFFVPFFFLPDNIPEPINMAWVIMLALVFSLIESLLILPAHLAGIKPESEDRYRWLAPLTTVRKKCADGMTHMAENVYQPFVAKCMNWSLTTVLAFVMFFVVILSVVSGGWMRFVFFPQVPIGALNAEATLYEGSPFSTNEAVAERLSESARKLRRELNDNEDEPDGGRLEVVTYDTKVRVSLELLGLDQSSVSAEELRDRWVAAVGELPNVKDFQINYTFFDGGKPIQLEIAAAEMADLRSVADRLVQKLSAYPGVENVRNTLDDPVPELRLSLKPEAESLGVSMRDIARQVRQGFYGEEVQRIPREREDVKVMVRYSADARVALSDLKNMRIRTPNGDEVPFDTVATYEFVPSFSTINHLDRQRTATVSADVQKGFAPRPIANALVAEASAWSSEFTGLRVGIAGELEQETEFFNSAAQLTFAALIVIYGLFAIVFRSWGQPILVVSAIPFGFAGAMIGHMLFAEPIAMFSILGVIAVAGVVVNDNLVMLDRINQLREEGVADADAILTGAKDRFRPIVLTSVTTFVSLLPVMTETSTQAQFLMPMVLSLAFGILLATFVTLLFVPSLYVLLLSVKRREAVEVSLDAGLQAQY